MTERQSHWSTRMVDRPPFDHLSIGQLVEGWQLDVQRFEDELDRDEPVWIPGTSPLLPSIHHVWNEHDFVGALTLRDSVEVQLHRLDGSDATEARAEVQAVDDHFLGFTEPDLTGAVIEASNGGAGGGWWWRRAPVRGPVRRSLCLG